MHAQKVACGKPVLVKTVVTPTVCRIKRDNKREEVWSHCSWQKSNLTTATVLPKGANIRLFKATIQSYRRCLMIKRQIEVKYHFTKQKKRNHSHKRKKKQPVSEVQKMYTRYNHIPYSLVMTTDMIHSQNTVTLPWLVLTCQQSRQTRLHVPLQTESPLHWNLLQYKITQHLAPHLEVFYTLSIRCLSKENITHLLWSAT